MLSIKSAFYILFPISMAPSDLNPSVMHFGILKMKHTTEILRVVS